MNILTKLIADDMVPSLGVTEPGAIALAVSKAFSCLSGDLKEIDVYLNSSMYKNSYTCGIPGTSQVGAAYAAALGAVAGDPELELLSLQHITPEDIDAASVLVQDGRVHIHMTQITPEIYIKADVVSSHGNASVVIEHAHTNVTSVTVNGKPVEHNTSPQHHASTVSSVIHEYTLRDFYQYATHIPSEELSFIGNAFEMNLSLLKAGLADPRTIIAHRYYSLNNNILLSDDAHTSAQLLASGAIEARVLGIASPAMSITGSGSHGIIAIMPLYALSHSKHSSPESLFRAAALSILVTQYIKEYSGKLSALCGCGVAAGTGAACGLAFLNGANYEQLVSAINSMTLGITGMICDGGNHGCAVKSTIAVDAAFRAVDWAMNGICFSPQHGICGNTPEETMRNIGLIASPGMLRTEETILRIIDNSKSLPMDKSSLYAGMATQCP